MSSISWNFNEINKLHTNKDKVMTFFRLYLPAKSQISVICLECATEVATSWKNKDTGVIDYGSQMTHLRAHHGDLFNKLTLRHYKPDRRRGSAPGNQPTIVKWSRLLGGCLWCGSVYNFGVLADHRSKEGHNSATGCLSFGAIYPDNDHSRRCVELISAMKMDERARLDKRQLLEMREQHRQQLIQFVDDEIGSIPIHTHHVESAVKGYGAYALFNNNEVVADKLRYGGRTWQPDERTKSHKTTKGLVLPDMVSLQVVDGLSYAQHLCAEYFLIQQRDIFHKYDGRPLNDRMPMPYCPHSQKTDGVEYRKENMEKHGEGRQMLAELLLDAVALCHLGTVEEVVIVLEQEAHGEDDEKVAHGSEAGADTPKTSRKRTEKRPHYPRRPRPSAPHQAELNSASASSSTASTPANPLSPLERLGFSHPTQFTFPDVLSTASTPANPLSPLESLGLGFSQPTQFTFPDV